MLRNAAIAVVRRLRDAGHEAFFAGGCVRDHLLGLEPTDYDVATSATPDQVEASFEHTIPVGRQFGILVVRVGEHAIEVATFREDDVYEDGRRPVAVHFTDAASDARRRDFTINAMFEDPLTGNVVDYVGGRADLAAGVIRAVGDPAARFAEDRLRLLRAVRFAARMGFRIDPATFSAVRAAAPHIERVSAERVGEEIVRILTEGAARTGFELLDTTGLLEHVLPELLPLKSCQQSPDYHPEGDVFTHTMLCIAQLPAGCSETLALGLLLHDVAKPQCAERRGDRWTFYGHTKLGGDTAVEICRRLRRSNAVAERVRFLVEQHLRHCSASGMRAATLKRFLRQEGIDELLELTRMDALASSGDLSDYEFCKRALAVLPDESMRPKSLLTGNDLIALGLTPGPTFREILHALEDAQLDGAVTTRDEALALVRSRYLGNA